MSSNYNLGFVFDNKSKFTHLPDGTDIDIQNITLSKIGISLNNFSNEVENRFICELIDLDFFHIKIPMVDSPNTSHYYDIKDYDKNVDYGRIKVLKINNDIFREIDNEWIKLHYGRGLYLLNSDFNIIIPSFYIAAGYSTFKPEKRNSGKLLAFSENVFSGLDLELGANINIEYKSLDIKGTFSYRRVFEINPDIEILQNRLKIGYTKYLVLEEQGIDSFLIQYDKVFSFFLMAYYDLLKVNSMIQENPSIGIQIDVNPILLLNIFY